MFIRNELFHSKGWSTLQNFTFAEILQKLHFMIINIDFSY